MAATKLDDTFKAPATPEPEDTGRGMDPELRTIGRMIRQLDDLDPAARARCVAYLRARYEEPV